MIFVRTYVLMAKNNNPITFNRIQNRWIGTLTNSDSYMPTLPTQSLFIISLSGCMLRSQLVSKYP